MRVRITCSVCSYRFHLPVSNVRFVEACPVCEAPKASLRLPVAPRVQVGSGRAISSGRWPAVAAAAAARPIRMPQPRCWRSI